MANSFDGVGSAPGRDEVISALEQGDVARADALLREDCQRPDTADPESSAASAQIGDIAAWPDPWLIAAIRCDPPDEAALDVLVDRYWKRLFARCRMLTLDVEEARDLAQEAWHRLLRARHRLKPDGNFPAFLAMVATNLWRDSLRFDKRAGPMARPQLAALDAPLSTHEGETATLADLFPDRASIDGDEKTLLKMDIDQALGRLTPLLRDILVARYIDGESCQEIGVRYHRTEQTISSWVREAVREFKSYFEESGRPMPRRN